jgi:glucose/arabinose dehydrogenase
MQRTSWAGRSVRIAALLATGAMVATACGATPTASPPTASPPPPSASSALSTSSAPTPSAAPSPTARPGSPGSAAIGLRTVARGFAAPVFVTHAGDGSGRLFVVEQAGRIKIVRDGSVLPTPFLDIVGRVSCCGERGLLGLAFAPGFGRTSASFFLDYTDLNGDTVIAEGTAGDGGKADTASPGSVHTLLHIGQPFANHNGGMLAFGPDGDLYVGMGDGGSGGDPQGNGQRLDTLLGKILRIDVSSSPGSYVVPSTNPFVGTAGAKPEIWSYGMRNPWRFSFDRATGDLWIGDVGQGAWEEVDVARAADGGGRGLNFGWNRMEGAHCFAPSSGCDRTGLTLPFVEYGHGAGDCAIIGGYVYRGKAIPGLQGTYLYGDECSGTIRSVAAAGPAGQKQAIALATSRAISSFGEDEAGEQYLTDLASGDLLQVVAAAP